ncbi:N-acetylneuraminate synthase family protein [uncultured Methanomethylovorans sp.]|uniref:N-acetylneuraminate synthase family protein n=1 Tax=uncultured Methanomethylovorans sp. TaxID=183759 RepID=UPI002AA94A72|nr:N-acetylneuraminate synthase family protein [uncultured Methanomethylovorans sp.]
MMYDSQINVNKREISIDSPTYFIADIASNHDGDIERANELIWLAKEAGADAVKFQHFKANKIVSDYGFTHLDTKNSHQTSWKKSVFEVYKQYECNRDWTEELAKTAKKAKIDFLTTPYDLEAVELLDPFIPAYKIGSGDITWIDFIENIARRNKPVILATGASNMDDVERAVACILKYNRQLMLLQCNTNYTGATDNFKYINLKVLEAFAIRYPSMILGLSDHTPLHATVLGAITLGARVIEKHFTDNNAREGPDHVFSMNPKTWREMIDRSRELELSLGNGIKRIELNEKETSIVQRRCLRLTHNMKAGESIKEDDLESLRPAPKGAIEPYNLHKVLGKTLAISKSEGDAIFAKDFVEELC